MSQLKGGLQRQMINPPQSQQGYYLLALQLSSKGKYVNIFRAALKRPKIIKEEAMQGKLVSAVILAGIVGAEPVKAAQPNNEFGGLVVPERAKHTPVLIQISDGNLIRVSQVGDKLYFSKTASGYGETGADLSIPGYGASLDYATANSFHPINALEALAFVDQQWNRFYEAALKQQAEDPSSLDPKLLRKLLEPLATIPAPQDDKLDLETWDVSDLDFREPESLLEIDSADLNPQFNEALDPCDCRSQEERQPQPVPVYLRLAVDGDVLLKITQENGVLHFYKTSSGQAVEGVKGHVLGFGAGLEMSRGDVYFEISPSIARALLGGDWRPIYDAALRQAKILKNSVPPQQVRALFE